MSLHPRCLPMLALLLACPGICAAASGKAQTVEQLRAALGQDRFVPRAFLKGDQVRLYFTNAEQRLNQEADLATSDAGFAARFRRELFETDVQKSFELKEPAPVDWTDHLADSILNQF